MMLREKISASSTMTRILFWNENILSTACFLSLFVF